MHVAEIRETLARFNNSEMYVQVAVWSLSTSDHLDQFFDCRINSWEILLLQEVASALDPLGYIAIPEEVVGYRPDFRRIAVCWMPLELEGIVAARSLQDVELIQQRAGCHRRSPSPYQRRGWDMCTDEAGLWIGHGSQESEQQ